MFAGPMGLALKYEMFEQKSVFAAHCRYFLPSDYEEWCYMQEFDRRKIKRYRRRIKDPKDQATWFDPGTYI